MIKLQAPYGRKHRVSSDSAWPLRNSDGLTFAEAKRLREQDALGFEIREKNDD